MIESVLMKKYKEVSVQKEEINQTDEDIMLEKTATQVSDTENTQDSSRFIMNWNSRIR